MDRRSPGKGGTRELGMSPIPGVRSSDQQVDGGDEDGGVRVATQRRSGFGHSARVPYS